MDVITYPYPYRRWRHDLFTLSALLQIVCFTAFDTLSSIFVKNDLSKGNFSVLVKVYKCAYQCNRTSGQ